MRAGDGGGHGHSHAGKHGGNINLRGAVIHILGDLVQSVGVAFAGALIWWKQARGAMRGALLSQGSAILLPEHSVFVAAHNLPRMPNLTGPQISTV